MPNYSFYSLVITSTSDSSQIFNGYFKVDSVTGLIVAIYDLSLPSGNGYTDVKLPKTDVYSYQFSDDIWPLTDNGTNFYSDSLRTFFPNNVNTNHFNIWYQRGVYYLYLSANSSAINDSRYTITSEQISDPSAPVVVTEPIPISTNSDLTSFLGSSYTRCQLSTNIAVSSYLTATNGLKILTANPFIRLIRA